MFVFTAFSSVYAIESPRYADDETHMIEGHEFMKIVDGLTTPTSMTFVDNDILVIEKNSGKVIHVKSDDYTKNEILDFSVSFGDESGLLGITSIENNVFLYMTESLSGTDVYDNTNSRIAIYHFVWKDEISETIRPLFEARLDYINAAFNEINSRHKRIEDFVLNELDVDTKTIENIKNKILE